MNKILPASVFIFSFLSFSFGQTSLPMDLENLSSSEREEMAFQSIHDIYEGVLVVRLSSNFRKAKILERQIKDTYSSVEQRLLYKKMLEKSNAETRENNELLMAAFSDNYDFSEVFFIYDTTLHYLTEGNKKGIFLGQDLKIDSTINLAARPYRMARYGSPLTEGFHDMVGMVIMDNKYQDLPPPFPYKSIGFRSAVVNSEKRKERLLRHFKKIVGNLNHRFHLFYRAYKAEKGSSN